MSETKKYDVIILGGGLAGLSLALQLKKSKPDISLLILEKRKESAPLATHKVGESTVEISSYYLREIVGLKDHLEKDQLPKLGLRFFFSPKHKDDISRRVEVGTVIMNPYPAHQVDRGLLENEMERLLVELGVGIILGAKVKVVDLSKKQHSVSFERENVGYTAEGRWIIDASGRNCLLKRKLGLEKEMKHDVNAAWFRVNSEIDIDDWSNNLKWKNYLDKGRRRLATNHLMDKGYWVWIIPLASSSTSIGIVADSRFHPFEEFNTFEKAMKWLEKNEPLAFKMLDKVREKKMDFKVMKRFAHDIKQFYSTDRWGTTGEAGAFLDPFYSPGSDFIALANSWISDLILRDLNGEDVLLRTMIYEHAHRELLNGWLLLYQNKYELFGNTQVMLMKVVWDWATYWAIPCVLFMNNGYTDLSVLKQYSSTENSIGKRFGKLNEQMQDMFALWNKYDFEQLSDSHKNLFDLSCLHQFHLELNQKYNSNELIKKIQSNLKILELIASEIFRMASAHANGTPIDMNVNPYEMVLSEGSQVLLMKSKESGTLVVNVNIKADIGKMWLTALKPQTSVYAK